MNSIVILTALTATSGLFGGGRHARAAHQAAYARPVASVSAPCRTGTCPQAYVAQPSPTMMAAPQAVAAPSQTYTSYYSAPMAPCATGTCPRR